MRNFNLFKFKHAFVLGISPVNKGLVSEIIPGELDFFYAVRPC